MMTVKSQAPAGSRSLLCCLWNWLVRTHKSRVRYDNSEIFGGGGRSIAFVVISEDLHKILSKNWYFVRSRRENKNVKCKSACLWNTSVTVNREWKKWKMRFIRAASRWYRSSESKSDQLQWVCVVVCCLIDWVSASDLFRGDPISSLRRMWNFRPCRVKCESETLRVETNDTIEVICFHCQGC